MSETTPVAYPTHAELLLRYLQRERENLIGSSTGSVSTTPADR